MSIRLQPCDWTWEASLLAMCPIMNLGRLGQALRTFGVYGDSRDADLMYYAQTNGKLGYVAMSTNRDAANFVVWVRAPSACHI